MTTHHIKSKAQHNAHRFLRDTLHPPGGSGMDGHAEKVAHRYNELWIVEPHPEPAEDADACVY